MVPRYNNVRQSSKQPRNNTQSVCTIRHQHRHLKHRYRQLANKVQWISETSVVSKAVSVLNLFIEHLMMRSTSPGEQLDGSHAVSSWQILALKDHTQMKHTHTDIHTIRIILYYEYSKTSVLLFIGVGGFRRYIFVIFFKGPELFQSSLNLWWIGRHVKNLATKIICVERNHMWVKLKNAIAETQRQKAILFLNRST